jgi:hypothetical protein
MPKTISKTPNPAAAVSADTDGMTTILYGDAVAVGVDTLTSVNVSVETKEHRGSTISKGTVTVTAAAESYDGGAVYADATTEVAVSGTDLLITQTKNKSGGDPDSSYDISVTNFTAIDIGLKSGKPKVIQKTSDTYDSGYDPIDLQGNVAIVIFDGQVIGDDTLVIVDAYALAVEDELSLSTVMITSAVG